MMRSILFDFGGTLDCPRHWLDRFLTHYRAAGIDLTREQLDLAFDNATQAAYRAAPALARFGLAELVDYLVGLQIDFLKSHGPALLRENLSCASAGTGPAEIAGRIVQSFVAESRAGFAATREVLAALSGHFRMGVVSNFYGNLENILAEADLARFFLAIADSSRVGIFKPERGIFVAALERLGANPAETAMVGDSLEKDCRPARELGITAIWLRHPGTTAELPDGRADFAIDGLAELPHLKWFRD